MVEAETSERPMYFILPSSISFFTSPIFYRLKEAIASFFMWFTEDEGVKMGGTNRDFDGNSGVDAVLVIEIDAIQVEALQPGSPRVFPFPSTQLIPNLVANSTFSLTPPFKACMRPTKRKLRANEQHKQRKQRKIDGIFSRTVSLFKGSKTSAVSTKVMPEWTVWWMRAIMSSSGLG